MDDRSYEHDDPGPPGERHEARAEERAEPERDLERLRVVVASTRFAVTGVDPSGEVLVARDLV